MEWTDAVGAFEQALQRFREVLAEPETTVVRDAAIKRFEFTFELGWKATQRFLRAQGIVSRSPKQCLQEAFAFGLVQDNPLWIRMLEDRNLTVHTLASCRTIRSGFACWKTETSRCIPTTSARLKRSTTA